MVEHYQITGRSAAELSANVESAVRSGALPAGAVLPSVRALAAQLGLSPGTVAKAYQDLRHRGLVTTAGRHGTRVRPRPPVATPRWMRHPPPIPGALDLSTGTPDARLLPPIREHLAAIAAHSGPPVGYATSAVLPELAELARSRLTTDGVPADAVTVTSGALDGVERLLLAHLNPGDLVAVEDPGWANLLDLLAALGLRPVGVPVNDDGPTVEGVRVALTAGARALIVTSRAQNPIGAAVSAERARQLRALLAGHPDLLLIEDDHLAELAPLPLHSLAAATRTWAFLRSTSKPYGPDLRLAVLAGDEATVARVAGRMRLSAGWVSTLLQRLVVRLWQDPEVTEFIGRAQASYETRRVALLTALGNRGIGARGRTGVNIWIPVPDETRSVTMLRDAGYLVAPGSLYRIAAAPGIRITVSGLDPVDIDPLADAIARAVGPAAPAGFTA